MRYAGEEVSLSRTEVVVIPRKGDLKDLIFTAVRIDSYDAFDALCPRPEPPTIRRPGDAKGTVDVEDQDFTKELTEWSSRRFDWMVITSLVNGTPDMELEQVDLQNPETWEKFQDELTEAGFSSLEVTKIVRCAITANGLDRDAIEQATESFLAGTEKKPE